MEQLVRVVQVFPNGTAKVLRVRESACSGDCHKCSGCGAQQQTLQLTAENPIGARPGETVRLHSSTAAVLKAAAVVYLLPLVLFIGGESSASAGEAEYKLAQTMAAFLGRHMEN